MLPQQNQKQSMNDIVFCFFLMQRPVYPDTLN